MAIITQSIGSAAGRDFPTPEAWWAAIPADVVAAGNSYVGEMYNDSEFSSAGSVVFSGKTTGAGNTITLRAAAGQSYRDHAAFLTNAYRYDATKGVAWYRTGGYGALLRVQNAYVTIQGLQLKGPESGNDNQAAGVHEATSTFDGCILECNNGGTFPVFYIELGGGTVRNSLIIARSAQKRGINLLYAGSPVIEKCTIVCAADVASTGEAIGGQTENALVRNVAVFGFGVFTNFTADKFNAGSGYNASDKLIGFGTNNLQSLVYADQFEAVATAASADYRLKATSALIDAGTPAGTEIGAWASAVVDAVAPTVIAATVNNTVHSGSFPGLRLEFSEGIDTNKIAYADYALSGGHTFTGTLTVPSGKGTLGGMATAVQMGVLEAFTAGEVVTLSYTKAATGTTQTQDAAGNQMESFVNMAVTNDTPVPDTTAPTLVSAEATNGDTVVLTFSETLGAFTPTAADFTFSGAQATVISRSAATITLSGFSPDYANGQSITVAYTKPASNALRDTAGNEVGSFAATAVTNNITNRPTLTGYTVKLYGDDPTHDFSTVEQVNTYINALTLNDTTGPVMIYCYKDMDVSGRQIGPTSSDINNFVTLRPAPGLGYSDIEGDDAALQYGTVGLEMVVANPARFRMGMEVTGWRVKQTATASSLYGVWALRRDGWGQVGDVNRFHHNRVLILHTSKAFETGEYGAPGEFYDNLYIVDAANTALVVSSGAHNRCTFVRLNGAVGYRALEANADNCVFAGCGGDVMSGNGAGNFTDTAQTTAKAGLTTVPGAFFVSATNYRPATGTPMIGGATSSAVSTNDNNGNNRGLSPDAGAAQLVPATPLPTGTITQQFPIDGQTLKITLTTTGTPTSGKVTLSPANPPNGASSIGPVDLVLSLNAASVEIDDIPAGNYLAPTVTLTNAGGTVLVLGTTAFEVMGVGNLVYDGGDVGTGGGGTAPTDPNGAAPTVSITTQAGSIMDGPRATVSGSVNLQGDVAGTLQLFIDPQPSGAVQGPFSPNISGSTWTIQRTITAGRVRLRVVATANGQSVTVQTAELTILGLTGAAGLPT